MTIDNEHYQTYQRRGCIFVFITALARIFGLITLIGLIFLTYVEWASEDSLNFRIYITIITSIMAYLEFLWIFDKCVTCCMCCCRSEICFYWICCIPIDNWVKTILYIGISIPFFTPTWILSNIRIDIQTVGVLLIITGVLYFLKTFKYKKINDNDNDAKEDDNLFNTLPRTSISTQTSTIGINNDNLSSTFTIEQELNKKH